MGYAVAPARLGASLEVHDERQLGVYDLPRIAEAQPVVRLLDLVAVVDMLLEDAVVVAEAVADRRQLQCRHGVEKTGGEPPEAAIAERRVGFDVAQHVPVEA